MMNFSERVMTLSSPMAWSPEAHQELQWIEKNLEKDLSPSSGKYFSPDTKSEISLKASQELATRLLQVDPLDSEKLRAAWLEVVTDFHRQQAWGFQSSRNVMAAPKTSEQKMQRELFTYIGYAVLIVLVIKSAFAIFGLIGANDPDDPVIRYGFWVSLLLALVLTAVFVWKKSKTSEGV